MINNIYLILACMRFVEQKYRNKYMLFAAQACFWTLGSYWLFFYAGVAIIMLNDIWLTVMYIYRYITDKKAQCAFTLIHYTARLMTVTGKFRLLIGRRRQWTNRRLEFSSYSHEWRAIKVQCKGALNIINTFFHKSFWSIFPL